MKLFGGLVEPEGSLRETSPQEVKYDPASPSASASFFPSLLPADSLV